MVGARPLADGGLLVLLDGKSHSIYWQEEVGALRVMVDAKTCLIEQENDPTKLRSPSPGKLIRYFFDSGDHVKAGDQYAEIEVRIFLCDITTLFNISISGHEDVHGIDDFGGWCLTAD